MKVFISYSRKDSDLVQRLSADLTRNDIVVWLDTDDLRPGTPNWEEALRDAIDGSDWVLLAASPEARESIYVQDELAYAQQNEVPILPLWVRGQNWLDVVPLGMGHAQYIDLRGNTYEAGLRRTVGILNNEEPAQQVETQSQIVPPEMRDALLYGLPGGILAGIALQYPFRAWFEDTILPPAPIEDGTFWGPFLALNGLLVLGLALTMLFVNRRRALPTARAQDLHGVAIGLLYGLGAHLSITGAAGGLLANRWMFHSFLYPFDSAEWLEVIATSVSRTIIEGMGGTSASLGMLALAGLLLGRWLLPLDTYTYKPPRVRDLFWPMLAVVMAVTLEIVQWAAVVIFVLLDESLRNMYVNAEATPSTSILVMILTVILAVKLLFQVIVIVWVVTVPTAAVHRTGLRTAQIIYGLLLGAGYVLVPLLIQPGYFSTPWTLAATAASVGLALAFAVVAEWRLRQAAANPATARLKLSWWGALRAGFGVTLLTLLVTDVLLIRITLNLVVIPVTLIPEHTLETAPFDAVVAVTLHRSLPVVTIPGLVLGAVNLAILVTYMLWATRRERRLNAA